MQTQKCQKPERYNSSPCHDYSLRNVKCIPSRKVILIYSVNYKQQAGLHKQQLNVLISYYESPRQRQPSLSHSSRFIIRQNQSILGQLIA